MLKKRKFEINNLTLHLEKIENEQTKPKVSRRKDIKIRIEIETKNIKDP